MLGRVYMIQSPNTDKVYIGSTFRTLKQRFGDHKKPCKNYSSKIIIEEGDSYIELLEEIKVIDERELEYYEQQYIELYRDIAVNQYSAFGGVDKKETAKKYQEKNRDKILEKKKKRYNTKYISKIQCVCGSNITKHNMYNHLKTQKHKNYVAQE